MTITPADIAAARSRGEEASAALHRLRVGFALQNLLEEGVLDDDSHALLTRYLIDGDQDAGEATFEILDQLAVVNENLDRVLRRQAFDWSDLVSSAYGASVRWWRRPQDARGCPTPNEFSGRPCKRRDCPACGAAYERAVDAVQDVSEGLA